MTKAYKGAHCNRLDGKYGDDEADKTRLLFFVYFSLNLTKNI